MGWWSGGELAAADTARLGEALRRVREDILLVQAPDGPRLARGGVARLGGPPAAGDLPLVGHAATCPPERLGDAGFRRDHGLRHALVAGAMANGIGSVEIVVAMARAGLLGVFGAAGLSPERVEEAVDRVQAEAGDLPHAFNLIHSPAEQALESAVVDLYLRRDVRLVEASAYLDLTPHVVRYRLAGIHATSDGRIVTPRRILAKASRVEVARRFFAPAPPRILAHLVQSGALTDEQARLAEHVPVAGDLTAEADSGGHTDNRPALALLPTMLALRDRCQEEHGYAEPLRVGAAGGIATPASAAAAFALGAGWVLTGTVNQACVESGSSDAVRALLAEAGQADVAMAPAADMFEMGVKVQVLKRGTLFAVRAAKLYELYRSHDSLDALPAGERAQLEDKIFRQPLDRAWADTRRFWLGRDPAQVERAERDQKHRMALVFRSYLGLSSRWANTGEPSRRIDYQVWCGPAMGAFNEWAKGSFLEDPKERRVATVARNLLHGACVLTRLGVLRSQGAPLPPNLQRVEPLRPARMDEYLQDEATPA